MTTFSNIADDAIERDWATNPRWAGVERSYDATDVIRLRGSIRVEHSLARRGAEQLWSLLHTNDHVSSLGAINGPQAVELVRAGLKAIYLSGWQLTAEGNTSERVYPGQGLHAADGIPALVRQINNALRRADQIDWAESFAAGDHEPAHEWLVPIVADAGPGFGGALNAYELMRSMIEAGAAGVHFEDQLSSERRYGQTSGRVLVPTGQQIRTLNAARLAADVAGVPSLIMARTELLATNLLSSDVDERDREFTTGERSPEGFYHVAPGIEMALARALAYAPYADVLWCEAATPELEEARIFAERIKAEYPDKLLAYSCSPSFNWPKDPGDDSIARFQRELGAIGFAFQFVTPAGSQATNEPAFGPASGYLDDITATLSGGMALR